MNDNLNSKASEVNIRLVHLCAERSIPYIDHTTSIQPENNLNESKLHFNDFLVTNDQVANALSKFENHPSIVMIKNKRKTDQCFSFFPVTYDDILKETNNLDTAKASFVKISRSIFRNQCSHQI